MMIDWIPYSLKVILFHGICYAAYWCLLRKSGYFTVNRVYLLGTLFLGLVAPVVMLPSLLPVDVVVPEFNVVTGTISEEETAVVGTSSPEPVNLFSVACYLLYFAGVLLLTLRSVRSIMFIWRLKSRAVSVSLATPKTVIIRETMSFSFINTIFLQESASPAVYLHERAHVMEKHWLDLILMEVVCIACWINPFAWLYRMSLKQQHEYLADDYVVRHGVSREEYLLCILDSLSSQAPIGPIHKFNSQSLKQRIIMMTKNHISPYVKFLYIGLVPLVAILFFSFSKTTDYTAAADEERIIVIDPAHGGKDAGAVSSSGVSEKDIALNLARLIQQIGKEKGLNIQLTRTTDRSLGLEERVQFSAAAQADVFLSIHVGFDKEGIQKGLEVYVCDENGRYADSKRMAGFLSSELNGIKEFGDPVVRTSRFYVLKHNRAASAVLEAGYLSDEQNTTFISDPVNQKRVAEKIVSALAKY